MTAPGVRSAFAFTATRPVAITMVVAAVVVFGFVGLSRLPVNLLPDISYPTVTVRTTYPGASPRDVEERVSERVQEAVSVIAGVRRVVSISRPEVSDVVLEFEWGTEMLFAVSDIRERLDRVLLPREAEEPLVLRYDPSLDPVLTLGLSGDVDPVELRRIADEEVERELNEVEGVAAVKVRGGEEEEVRVAVDEEALSFFGIDVATIAQRLANENVNAAAGAIEEGQTEYLVRLIGEFPTVASIERMVVDRRGDVPIRLDQVARVQRLPADREVIALVDGRPTVLVDVYKEAGANIVALCERVRERVFGSEAQRAYVAAGKADAPPALAAAADAAARRAAFEQRKQRREMTDYLAFDLHGLGVEVASLQDQSRFIRSAVDDVLSSAVQGGLFAILIIYLFLRRFAATAILAVSIPLSLVATFAPMFMSDIDLNIMSLGGLALGVGMLVDNSIVVLESIARAREEGHGAIDAGVLGVSRVAGAVIASTLTTVAVFFPIVFVEGVAGQLFRDQALTVVYALLMSLLVALFVIPMLATRRAPALGTDDVEVARAPEAPRHVPAWRRVFGLLFWPLDALGWVLRTVSTAVAIAATRLVLLAGAISAAAVQLVLWPFAAAFDAVYRAADRVYPGLVARALQHRGVVVLAAVALLGWALSRIPDLGSEMLPEVHQGELYVDAFLPRDATVERTHDVLAPVEAAVAKLPDVRQTFLAAGVEDDELHDSDQGEHSARLLVRMDDDADRLAQEERVRTAIRDILRHEPAVQSYRFSRPTVLSLAAPLVVEVLGDDLVQLRQAAAQVEAALREVPGLRDVRSTLQRGNPELAIELDRDKLAALGIEPETVTSTLRAKVQGEVPTRFTERERKIDVRVRVDRDELRTLDELLQLDVATRGPTVVPLLSVARIQRLEGPSEIRRLGNVRGAEVQASLVGLDLGSTQQRVVQALAELDLPQGIEARLGGQKADFEQSQQSLVMALLLAVFLVYIVMASQFESMVQPLVILVSMPLALVGVVLTLDLLEVPLSVVVFLGGIVLAGIVVNNAIILIDQINRLRREGMAKAAAIAAGAHTRLRPVLMTTMTTVLGLLPLTGWLAGVPLLGGATEGLELRAPMAITVISGLLSSTILTLVVVPVVYSFSDRKP